MDNITFTAQSRDSLREAHDKATKDNAETFLWNGKRFLTSYAKYLLQWLDTKFPHTEEKTS